MTRVSGFLNTPPRGRGARMTSHPKRRGNPNELTNSNDRPHRRELSRTSGIPRIAEGPFERRSLQRLEFQVDKVFPQVAGYLTDYRPPFSRIHLRAGCKVARTAVTRTFVLLAVCGRRRAQRAPALYPLAPTKSLVSTTAATNLSICSRA